METQIGGSIIVDDRNYVFTENGYAGTVMMAGSGDIFLDSVDVVENVSMEKDYDLSIVMGGGSASRVFMTFDSNTVRTALFHGSISGKGTLVLESRTRGLTPVFDLTDADLSRFAGTVQAAAVRTNDLSCVQIQAGGGRSEDMAETTIDLSRISQGGQDPQAEGFDRTKPPRSVILHLAGDLNIKGLAGTTSDSSSRVTVGNGEHATLTLNNSGYDVFLGCIGGTGDAGGYFEGGNKKSSYQSLTGADGTGVINLVKQGAGSQTLKNAEFGQVVVKEGSLVIAGGGSLSVRDSLSVSSGALLRIQSGSLLNIGFDTHLSQWNTSSIPGVELELGARLGFGGRLELEVGSTLISGLSLYLANSCILAVSDSSGSIVEGKVTDILSFTEGSLTLEDQFRKEIVKYIAGYDADGEKIYQEMEVTAGGPSLVFEGNASYQGFIQDHDSMHLSGIFISSEKFDHYVWQGNSGILEAGNCWSSTPKGSSPWEGNLLFHNGEKYMSFGMEDLSGHAVESYNVTLEGILKVAGVTVTVDDLANDGFGYIFSSGETEGVIADSAIAATLEKFGAGMLFMCTSNTYSGGTVLWEGSIMAARSHALGTGTIQMHDGTALYVNYPYESELDSSFRNPVFTNAIQIGTGKEIAKVKIGYSPVSLGERLSLLGTGGISSNDSHLTSRHWRNFHLSGGLYGNGGIDA